MGNSLTFEEQKLLLAMAREAIISHLGNGPVPQTKEITSVLQEKRGCFVSIKANGKLRGCIGNFESDKPLHQLVEEMAVSAATKDPRFYPMRKEDLKDFTSGNFRPCPSSENIGHRGNRGGGSWPLHGKKFLPRRAPPPGSRGVRVGQGNVSQPDECQGRLKPGDWKEGADIYIFSADVFKES